MLPALLPIPELFRNAWERYTKGFDTYLKFSFVLGLLVALISLVDPKRFIDNSALALLYMLLQLAIIIWVSAVVETSLMYAVADHGASSPGEYYEKGQRQWKRYVLTKLLQGVMILAGFILLVIPGLIFLTQFVVAEWVAIFESMRPSDALRQSKFYVKGRAWSVFGRFILIVLTVIPFQIVGSFFNSIAVDAVLVMLLVPWNVACMYVLYTDLVRTKEKEAGVEAVLPALSA